MLLRAGQRARAGVCSKSARSDLLVLTSLYSLMEVALPQVAVQVVTFGAQGNHDVSWVMLAQCTRAATSCLPWSLGCCRLTHTWQWRVLKEELCSLRAYESAHKREGWAAKGMGWGRRKREESIHLYVIDRAKILFLLEVGDSYKNYIFKS